MKKETLGKLFLLTAALIWGSSFVVMKSAVDFITPFVLLFIRFTLSTLFMSCLFLKKIKIIKIKNTLWVVIINEVGDSNDREFT